MLNIRQLKAEMVRNGYTQESLAKELGITSRTFHNRLKSGNFKIKDVEKMIELLNLSDPLSIFLA